jgi:hypothetical protein
VSRIKQYRNIAIVWMLTGLWHGAAWNFIVWGLMNAVIILISERLTPLYGKFHKKYPWSNTRMYTGFMCIRTTLLMGFLRMFDCYRDVPLTFQMFGSMLFRWNLGAYFNGSLLQLGITKADYLILLAGTLVLLTASLLGRRGSVREQVYRKSPVLSCVMTVTLFLVSHIIRGTQQTTEARRAR